MATERRTKRFIYKKACFLKTMDSESLESVLKQAVKAESKPMKRRHNPTGDNMTFCFLNSTGTRIGNQGGEIFGCEFLSYVQGADQSTLSVSEEEDEVSIGSLPAQNGQEYLEGNLYFGVLGNHVVVMQSSALRVKQLEDHLNWFLVQKTRVIDSENRVELHDATPGEANPRKVFGDAKGLRLDAPVHWSALTDEKDSSGSESVKVQPLGAAWAAVQALLAAVDLPNYLKAASLEELPSLSVELFLKWNGQAKDQDSMDFMSAIAGKLRHIDDEIDYHVETKSGSVGREDFKLRLPVSVPWRLGRPEFDSLFPKMISWLVELESSGKIPS